MANVTIAVNGAPSTHDVEPRLLLVHYLRETLALTGTHVGCDTSQCGACAVLLDGVAVKSCTVLAVQADGSEVTTIEGLARGAELHPLQQAFREEHGLQCGFCTPGMVIAAYDLLRRNPRPTPEQVRHELEGNLCRCTGYHNIVKAVINAAQQLPPFGGQFVFGVMPSGEDAVAAQEQTGRTGRSPAQVGGTEISTLTVD